VLSLGYFLGEGWHMHPCLYGFRDIVVLSLDTPELCISFPGDGLDFYSKQR
jgi:hypothetical protein